MFGGLQLGQLGFNLVGMGAKYLGAQSQIHEQRKTLTEELRRQQLSQDQILGEARARAAASGVQFNDVGQGSLQQYLTRMSEEYKRQLDWARSAGNNALTQADRASVVGLMSDFGKSIFSYYGGQMGK